MKYFNKNHAIFLPLIVIAVAIAPAAMAHSLIVRDVPALVAKSNLQVTPSRDWNKLSVRPGKKAETWTLDGEQLNDVSFYGAIAAGEPMLRERSKKRDPLPKLPSNALITDIPEFLEGSYRASLGIANFTLGQAMPVTFLGGSGVRFQFEYVTGDDLVRHGDAVAALRDGKLYMITYDAPRLHFFQRNHADFEALVQSASLN